MPPKKIKPISFEGAIKDTTVSKDILPIIAQQLHNAGIQSVQTQRNKGEGPIVITFYGMKPAKTISIDPKAVLASPKPAQYLQEKFAL